MRNLLGWLRVILLLLMSFSVGSSFSADSLLDIYLLAKDSDPQLSQAVFDQKMAMVSKRQNVSKFLPSLRMGGDVTNYSQKRTYDVSQFNGEEEYDGYGYSVTLNQPLFRYENHVRYKQSKTRIKQTNAEFKSVEQSLIIRLSERYFDVLAAQDNKRFISAEKKAVERQLKQETTRLEAGLAAITDVYEAKAQLDSTISLEIDAQIQWDNSLESLREITNRYHKNLRPLKKNLSLTAFQLFNIEKWVELAFINNLALIALRYNHKVLQHEISLQRTGHYPTLDLIAKFSKMNSGGGNFGRSDTEMRTVGIQFNMPLFQGGLVNARVKEAVLRYEQNLEKLDATLRSVRREVRQAYFGVTGSIARMKSLKQSTVSNAKALKAIEAGKNAGLRTTADVLRATKALYQAERDYERVRYDYVLNGLKLKKATGVLSLSDLEKVNLWLKVGERV